jgi:putative acetyltransferase
MNRTIIRSYRTEDDADLWAVFHSAIHEVAAADYTREQVAAWAPAGFDPSKWSERMRGIAPFVAERDGTIVGYADVQENGYIDHFFVAGAVVRQGIGSRLMQSIHAKAVASGLESLFSDVSITAKPFFERWGFIVEKQQEVTVRGITLTNFRMRKSQLTSR